MFFNCKVQRLFCKVFACVIYVSSFFYFFEINKISAKVLQNSAKLKSISFFINC